MPKRRKAGRSSGSHAGNLAELRKEAMAAMKRLSHAGRRQLAAIDGQINKLNRQRQALLDEISAAMGRGRGALGAGGGAAAPAAGRRRRGRRSRVNWDKVFSKLPRGQFKASHVRQIVPGVAAGTLSQRLTGWVKEKKLKRTGSRRGTSYTRAA